MLERALKAGVLAQCVQVDEDECYPARVWFELNGVLHEARRTNRGNGEFHAFPLEFRSQWPRDPHGLLESLPNVEI